MVPGGGSSFIPFDVVLVSLLPQDFSLLGELDKLLDSGAGTDVTSSWLLEGIPTRGYKDKNNVVVAAEK